MHRDALR